jgi:hypothetical protein
MSETRIIPVVLNFIRMVFLMGIIIFLIFKFIRFSDLFVEQTKFGLEQIVSQNNKTLFIAENGYCSENALFRTNEYAFEGSYALKLDSINRFGLSTAFEVPKSQDSVEASVWIYSSKIQKGTAHEAFIVASIGDVFWKGSNIITDTKFGWHKLYIKFAVPASSYTKPLTIYCWNNNNYEVYFDNLIINRSNLISFSDFILNKK